MDLRPALAYITGHTKRLLDMTSSWTDEPGVVSQHRHSYEPRQQESIAVQLGEAGVERLAARFLSGERQQDLANEYGYSLSTVQRLLRLRGVSRA